MSIHFISGKPAGGKTLYGMRLIVEELVHGTRPVHTNVPIIEGELRSYLSSKYPERYLELNLWERLRLLSDDETGRFWCYRPGCEIEFLGQDNAFSGSGKVNGWREGRRPDYSGVKDKGVMFVIDELHNFFGSRQWQLTGQDVLFYLSQHRKLGDTVICITQAVGNVDKQFRSVTQDFTYLRNLSKERYGLFRLPAWFLRRTFTSPPGESGKGAEAMESGTFTLDVSGLARCYNTAAGVGIHAKVGDIGERKKGRHWGWGIAAVVLLVLAVGFGVPPAIASLFKSPQVTRSGAKGSPASKVAPAVVAVGRVSSGVSSLQDRGVENGGLDTNYCKGYASTGKDMLVVMSDGAVLSFRKGEVLQVHERYVVLRGGRVYPIREH